MAQTHDFGRLFTHTIQLVEDAPLAHRAKTVEIDPPFRQSRPLVLRVPFTGKALVIGWWLNTAWDEETALLEAVSGWGVDPYDESIDDPEVQQTIRENVARSGLDLDDEWHIVSALGADR